MIVTIAYEVERDNQLIPLSVEADVFITSPPFQCEILEVKIWETKSKDRMPHLTDLERDRLEDKIADQARTQWYDGFGD